jgi:hypothetical protein
MALFRNFGVNHAKDATGERNRLCVMQNRQPPRNAAEFLELAKNCTFLDRKRISARYETADGHALRLYRPHTQALGRLCRSTWVLFPVPQPKSMTARGGIDGDA